MNQSQPREKKDACVVFVCLRQSSPWHQELLEMELVLGLGGEHTGEFEVCTEARPGNSRLCSLLVFRETVRQFLILR